MTPSVDQLFDAAVGRHRAGDLPAADRLYRQLLHRAPNHPGALANLGVIVARCGDPAEAERLYRQAIAADPGGADAHFNLGNLLRRLGRAAEAAAAYRTVLRLAPDSPRAYQNLGLAAGDLGDWAAAADSFRRAVALNPELADAHNLLGDALYRLGDAGGSVAAFRAAAARVPDDPRCHHNLGLGLAAGGAYAEAVPAFERALRLRPDYPEAHNALGVALEAVGRAGEAVAHYRRAAELRPAAAEVWSNLGPSLAERGQVGEAVAALTRAVELRPDPRAASNLLVMLAHSSAVSAARLRDEAVAWADRFAPAGGEGEPDSRPLPLRERATKPCPPLARPLRVGYVLGDARGRAGGPVDLLFAHHDRKQFHVTGYPCSTRPDDRQPLADGWRPTAGLSDDELAEAIRADGIDLLVDVCGHAPGGRLGVFARRPAAVQVTLFNLMGTTGVRAIDYRVSDEQADPPGADGLSVERVVRLPDVGWVYRPPADAPDPTRAAGGPFTLGCLTAPAKVSDACVEAWAAVLRAVPGSRLLLPDAGANEWMAGRFEPFGVTADRLAFVPRAAAGDLATYRQIDLALDPFPFNGGAVTGDALWMGVPVLTVAGDDCRSRQGVRVVTAVGLPEFVVPSADRLAGVAAAWAGQPALLADLRGSLRGLVAASPLADGPRFVRHLEATYADLCRAVSS